MNYFNPRLNALRLFFALMALLACPPLAARTNIVLMSMPNKSSQVLPAEFVPLWVPELYGNEWNYVKDCLDSSWISTVGSYVDRFERAIAEYLGNVFTVATVNGTAALHLAYLAIDLEQGDIVWTTPNTFVATVNAALYCGATVDFVDINPKTYNLSIDYLKEKLIQAKKDNKLPS